MSITKQTTVWCDECSAWEQATDMAKDLRAILKQSGWTHEVTPGDWRVDFCPSCSAKRKDARKAARRAAREARSNKP